MPNLALGLLKVNKNNFGADATNRLAEFELAVSQANSALKALQSVHGGVRMLVAPEYYWSGYDQIGQRKLQLGPLAMARDQKQALYTGLEKISRAAGSLVLVAGSIFYQKPNGARSSALSVCPVLRSGRFLLKHYKDMDDGAAQKNNATYDYTTKISDPFFTVDTIGFGIEVCGDHNPLTGNSGGRLAHWNVNAGQTVDVQLLVADSSAISGRSVVARNGGFLVQCDIGGGSADIAVYPAGGPYDRPNRIVPTSISGTQVNGASLICYNLAV